MLLLLQCPIGLAAASACPAGLAAASACPTGLVAAYARPTGLAAASACPIGVAAMQLLHAGTTLLYLLSGTLACASCSQSCQFSAPFSVGCELLSIAWLSSASVVCEYRGVLPAHLAVSLRDIEVVKFLLSKGVDFLAPDASGKTVFFHVGVTSYCTADVLEAKLA